MKNQYSKITLGVWLKSLLFVLLTSGFTTQGFAQNDAENVVDFGKMELDKDYTLNGDFKDYKGYFVAQQSGTLTGIASSGCLLCPYTDAECLQAAEYSHSYLEDGNEAFSLNIEAGQTYYLFLGFNMGTGTFKLTMNTDNGIKLLSSTPENGTTFDLSQGGIISVQFNQAVQIGGAMISCNQTMTEIPYDVQSSNVVFDIKERIFGLIEKGNLKPGDQFGIILHDICALNNDKLIYGEDGTLVLTYELGETPVSLKSTSNVENNPFLSYWVENDPKGIITLTFDGELQQNNDRAKETIATITAGELEAGAGGYYYEEVPYTVKGNQLFLNLTGKLRQAKNMLSPEFYPEIISIKIKDIRGANGKMAYFPGKGGLGSYSFDMKYEEVKADPISEFTPGNNSSLDNVESIEIWVTDYAKIKHDGVLFICGNGAKSDSVVVTDFEAVADTEYEGAYILNVKVPAAVKAHKGNVTVGFLHLECIDGLDHSKDLTASYTVTTGIKNLLNSEKETVIYHLKGCKANTQDIKTLPEGLYIINGKKYLIRH